jgi:hypothetical protein
MESACRLATSVRFHTRIGLPDHYWQHGRLTFLGFLVVLFLVEIAVVLMVRAVPWRSDDPRLWVNPDQREQPSNGTTLVRIAGLITPLATAAMLLQLLPEAYTGIQFLPVSPWEFSAWIPFVISLAVWAGLGGCVLIVIMPAFNKVEGVACFLLATMLVNTMLSFWTAGSS